MVLKKIALSAMLNLALLSSAYAGIMIQPSAMLGNDVCANVPGAWTGVGTITAKVVGVTVRCDYKGTATVSDTSSPGVFTADVNMNIVSGICPTNQNFTLPGTCDSTTGVIALQSSDADLKGSMAADGLSATLTGTVSVPIMGKTVKANVESLVLQKA
jgi:hypothetical protein